MRRLLPLPVEDIDPGTTYGTADRPATGGRPWVVANMIASADGTASVAGRSGGLGGPADRQVFRLLRSLADVVVAGASTVRVERYRPITGPGATPIAVVTRSLELDWAAPLFTAAEARTIVVTCGAADAGRLRQAREVADVVIAGAGAVDPLAAMAALGERGHRVVLCEGGPMLLAQLAATRTLDELCLTVSPLLAGGDGPRVVTGTHLMSPAALRLASLFEDDGFLLLRYLVGR